MYNKGKFFFIFLKNSNLIIIGTCMCMDQLKAHQ